jgi:hypothetical protein
MQRVGKRREAYVLNELLANSNPESPLAYVPRESDIHGTLNCSLCPA